MSYLKAFGVALVAAVIVAIVYVMVRLAWFSTELVQPSVDVVAGDYAGVTIRESHVDISLVPGFLIALVAFAAAFGWQLRRMRSRVQP